MNILLFLSLFFVFGTTYSASVFPVKLTFALNSTIEYQNFTFTGRISVLEVQIATPFPKVQICLRKLIKPENNVARWNTQTCDGYYDLRNGTRLAHNRIVLSRSLSSEALISKPIGYLGLLPGFYYVGVFGAASEHNCDITLAAKECGDNQFGDNCGNYEITSVPENQTTSFNIPANKTQFFQFDVKNQNQSLLLKAAEFKISRSFPPQFVALKFGELPVGNFTPDASWTSFPGEVDAFLPSPTEGSWYLSFRSRVNNNFTVHWNSSSCGLGQVGPDCSFPTNLDNVNSSSPKMSPGDRQWTFYKYNLTASNNTGFSFFVQLFDETLVNSSAPALYLRFGQAPNDIIHDVKVNTSTPVNALAVDHASPGIWYVGIPPNDLKWGFWYNSQCPNNCSSNGNCVQRSDGVYQCSCYDLYTRFDCSKRLNMDGFRKVYLVLIFIGVAVFGVSALGFFCLLVVSRKRKAGYTPLSQNP